MGLAISPNLERQRALAKLLAYNGQAATGPRLVTSAEWRYPGAPARFQISKELVEQIVLEMWRASKSPARRSEEIGGVLLGHPDLSCRNALRILDGEFANESRDLFSAIAVARLRCSIATQNTTAEGVPYYGRPHVVGYFRTAKTVGATLDDRDRELIRGYFSDPSHVVMIISAPESGAAKGRIFYRTEDSRVISLEFPFDPSLLPSDADPAVNPDEARIELIVPKPVAPAAAETVVPVEPPRSARRRWTAAAVALPLLAWLSFAWLGGSSPAHSPLDLRVERQGLNLRLAWNGRSPAVERARGGALVVSTGELERRVPLDNAQLRSGHLAYLATDSTVRLRLEVTQNTGEPTSESVLVMPTAEQEASRSAPGMPPNESVAARPPLPLSTLAPTLEGPIDQREKQIYAKQLRRMIGRGATREQIEGLGFGQQDIRAALAGQKLPGDEYHAWTESRRAAARSSAAKAAARSPRRLGELQIDDIEIEPDEPPALSYEQSPPESIDITAIAELATHPPLPPPTALSSPRGEATENAAPQPRPAEPPEAASAPSAAASTAPPRFIGPRPLSQPVRPSLAANVVAMLSEPVEVEVHVKVDAEGNVTQAEHSVKSGALAAFLAERAVAAARMTKFEPARLGTKAVEGEFLLKFRFQKPR